MEIQNKVNTNTRDLHKLQGKNKNYLSGQI